MKCEPIALIVLGVACASPDNRTPPQQTKSKSQPFYAEYALVNVPQPSVENPHSATILNLRMTLDGRVDSGAVRWLSVERTPQIARGEKRVKQRIDTTVANGRYQRSHDSVTVFNPLPQPLLGFSEGYEMFRESPDGQELRTIAARQGGTGALSINTYRRVSQ